MNEQDMNEKGAGKGSAKMILKVVAGIVGVGIVAAGLIFLARGQEYQLTVTNPIMGSQDAPVRIEEFADFQCPACRLASVAVEEIAKMYPTQVSFVYRDFPIPGHQFARSMAAAGLCSAQQGKFTEFYKFAFDSQTEWAAGDQASLEAKVISWAGEQKMDVGAFNTCRDSRTVKNQVESDYKEGISRTVNSTPTFFVDGEKQEGGLTVFQWIQKINAILEKKGLKPENGPGTTETPATPAK